MQHRVPLYSGPMTTSKLWLKFAQSIRWSDFISTHSTYILITSNFLLWWNQVWLHVDACWGGSAILSRWSLQRSRTNFEPWNSFPGSTSIWWKALTRYVCIGIIWNAQAFNQHFKGRLNSMESTFKVDSIAWNPHKMVGAPLQTSPFIVRHKV